MARKSIHGNFPAKTETKRQRWVRHVGGDDPRRLQSASVRFARPVFNGTTLSTIGWQQPDGSWSVETLGPDGKPVITNAVLRFRG